MKSKSFRTFTTLSVAVLLAITGLTYANGLNNKEVEFTGDVETVVINGEGVGTLFVTVSTIELRVIVNPKTIIQDFEETIITMENLAQRDLTPGLRVNIEGRFSSSGILADRIRILIEPGLDGAEDSFLVRGHITQIQPESDTIVSLLGIDIFIIDGDTVISKDGVVMDVEDLEIGTKVTAIGNIVDGVWIATQIYILTPGTMKGLLLFEGIVDSYDPDDGVIVVGVTGALEGNFTPVYLTPETQILGDLEVGAYVLVIGVLNMDYTVTAREVRVLSALEIKPDERKLIVDGNPATFTVKLREKADGIVTVNLIVDDPGVLQLLDESIEFQNDEQTADFSVMALTVGAATITATIDGTGESATALVKVGEVSEGDNERPEQDVRIFFSPDHIKLKPYQSREVVLHVHPPQQEDVNVVFDIDPDIVEIPTLRPLSNGSAMYKVDIKSLGPGGTASIIATLPDDPGGATAELLVEIKEK